MLLHIPPLKSLPLLKHACVSTETIPCVAQVDGNLVAKYEDNIPYWSSRSGPNDRCRPYTLEIRDDCVAVIRDCKVRTMLYGPTVTEVSAGCCLLITIVRLVQPACCAPCHMCLANMQPSQQCINSASTVHLLRVEDALFERCASALAPSRQLHLDWLSPHLSYLYSTAHLFLHHHLTHMYYHN
jgi:hypothetical protein